MERKIVFAPGEYYHIYNRGVNKGKIFDDSHDLWRFTFLLYLSNSSDSVHTSNLFQSNKGRTLLEMQQLVFEHEIGEPIVSIGAFCLMPNHFHLLVKEITDGGISKFMQKLSTAYTMYFNSRHDRTGAFFEGRFKAQHVISDNYLKYLFAYIHLNPVKLIDSHWKENGIQDKAKAEKYLNDFIFSSYRTYVGLEAVHDRILCKEAFPRYFEKDASFKRYINDWLSFKEDVSV